MSINIYASRREYPERCRFWKADEEYPKYQDLVTEKKCAGIFYAKEDTETYNNMDIDSGIVEINKQSTLIKTEDNVEHLDKKDIVEYAGELWIVVSVNSKRNNKASFFQRKPKRVWYIELRNGN